MMPISTAGVALALTLTLGSTAPQTGPYPGGQQPVCGATLTTDTTLTADLVCPAGDGLTIVGAITLDLGGHTLRGVGAAAGAGTGVRVDIGAHDVVRNGTVEGWQSGVGVSEDTGEPRVASDVSRVTFRANQTGIGSEYGQLDVSRSRFVENELGALLGYRWSATTFDRCSFERNAVAISTETLATVTRSSFTGNELALSATQATVVASDSRFVGNTTTARQQEGGLLLTGNLISHSELGVGGGSFGSVELRSNTFRHNSLAVDADGNSVTLRGNHFTRNDTAVRARDTHEIGAVADIDGDTFVRNGDAVYATGPSRIANVTAVRNTGWGIYAPDGVDGGGNVARLNGTEPQCVGVVCTAG
jgi:hypothetical protein